MHPDIGGFQRGYADAKLAKDGCPCSIRAKFWPGRPAQCQKGRSTGVLTILPVTMGKLCGPCLGKSRPACAGGNGDAQGREPLQPGAQERRGLQALGEHPPTRPNKHGLSQFFRPSLEIIGSKGIQPRAYPVLRGTIASREVRERFAMGEVEAAAAC